MTVSEPLQSVTDPTALLLGQLAFYRASLLTKLEGLSEDELVTSRLPSDWSPLTLLNHLVHVERRWMRWGFAGEAVPAPWADHDSNSGAWVLGPGDTVESLTTRLGEEATFTESMARGTDLTVHAALGGRFTDHAPTLGWILIHLVQEYARHLGHLDVVRELIDGRTGE